MTRGLISWRDLAYYTTKGIACQQKSVSREYFRKKEAFSGKKLKRSVFVTGSRS
jgi:hypothetical protein